MNECTSGRVSGGGYLDGSKYWKYVSDRWAQDSKGWNSFDMTEVVLNGLGRLGTYDEICNEACSSADRQREKRSRRLSRFGVRRVA